MISYKKSTTFDERKLKASAMKNAYPDRIPVIVEMNSSSSNYKKYINSQYKNKYLVPLDLTMSQLMVVIRKKINIDDKIALFFFVNNKLIPNTTVLGSIYHSEKELDDFLYVEFTEENTFGDN